MANKQDDFNRAAVGEVAQALSLAGLGQKWTIQGVSAIRGEGVFEAFSWLTST